MRGPGSYTYEPDNHGCVLLLEFIGRDPPGTPADSQDADAGGNDADHRCDGVE